MNTAVSIVCLLLLTIMPVHVSGSVGGNDDSLRIAPDTSRLIDSTDVSDSDTAIYRPTVDPSPAEDVSNPTDFEMNLSQNPTVALFKSVVVPGWGQLGNRRYFKAALFAGLETWFIFSAVNYGREASDFRRRYEEAETTTLRNQYYQLYDDRRDKRNQFLWFTGLTIFISMFDAYVDAHLSGSPDHPHQNRMDLEVQSDDSGGASVSLLYRF
jgi:hypothetical protein